MNKKSVIIDQNAHKELVKLSESLKLNYGSLIEEMIYYFKKTGIDPKESLNKNPSLMVSALDKRIVSFLKVQERDILKPLRVDVFNYQKAQKEQTQILINSINKLLNQHSEKMKEIIKNDVDKTTLVTSEFQNNRMAILKICELIDDKNKSGTIDKIKSIFS